MNVAIRGIGLISGFGSNANKHLQSWHEGYDPLHSLSDFPAPLGNAFDAVKASWIHDRSLMLSRKYGPATQLAIEVCQQAIEDAQLSQTEISEALLWCGSSRGNAAAVVDQWPKRRPMRILAASNSLHGEIPAAVSIEFGIHGAYHILANGCSASLDALGWAVRNLQSGLAKHAIVIGVELPISPSLLQDYQAAGMLTNNSQRNPYSPEASGFLPAEAACALVLEATPDLPKGLPTLSHYAANSDAYSLLGVPPNGDSVTKLLRPIIKQLPPHLICPHASGTPTHAKSETQALQSLMLPNLSVIPLKSILGHAIGASGTFEVGLLAQLSRSPSPLKPHPQLITPPYSLPFSGSLNGLSILKIASSMGGHNAAIMLTCGSPT